MYMMLGGMVALGYMKYKDGSMDRMMKNIKPMMECALEELKKQSRKIVSFETIFSFILAMKIKVAHFKLSRKKLFSKYKYHLITRRLK